eukprot:TRINITY_DN9746_c0_g1_i1.p1 TRINITY_DN9746_c0_g1~~TRINITY_DN9746_c0_g1_i1.p1  ORF type:complete len:234 (+),score=81.76 TRINITY_DN9746_c0_g1_i1:112-813(+)
MAGTWESSLEEYRSADTGRRREEEQQRQTECRSPLRDKYPSLRAELGDHPPVQQKFFAEQRADLEADETTARGGVDRDEVRGRNALYLHESQEASQLQRLEQLRAREEERVAALEARKLEEEREADTERRRHEEQSRQENTASPVRDQYPSLRGELVDAPKALERFHAEQREDIVSEEAENRRYEEKDEDQTRAALVLHEAQDRGQIEFKSRLSETVDRRLDEMRPPSPSKHR